MTIDHGTLTAVAHHGCCCPPCRATGNRYQNHRSRQIAYGQWQPYVDATPVREHVRKLQTAGLGAQRIASLANISVGAMWRLLYGDLHRGTPPSKRMRPATAAAILAVRVNIDTLDPRVRIDSAGTRRRIQALATLGWSLAYQAERLSRAASNYRAILAKRSVTAATARAVRDLYDQLSMTPAPPGYSAAAARGHAQRQGWLPPLAWDDDLIDLPNTDLNTEIARRVDAMTDDDLRRSRTSYKRDDDRSPLVVAAALEWNRRLKAPKQAAA